MSEHTHTHPHAHADNDDHAEKLEAMLPFLLKHNADHLEDIRKWYDKTEHAGLGDVASELKEIVGLFEKMDVHLQSAIDKLHG